MIVIFNDKKTGVAGQNIYTILDEKRYVSQMTLGYHPDLRLS